MRRMTTTKTRVHSPSLQTFTLADLAPFTKEGAFSSNASLDFHLFYVGRDDVHEILKYLLSRANTSLYLNMFGYDDEELNVECMRCAEDASVTTVITLDKSQAGGKHEEGSERKGASRGKESGEAGRSGEVFPNFHRSCNSSAWT
jgi:hypothetical protein